MASAAQQPLIYFHSLVLENVRCFGEHQVLELTDAQGRLARWTLLLGDNGVGKTTLLQCLAWMRPVRTGEAHAIEPVLNNEGNNVLNSLLRTGSEVTLELGATLSVNQSLGATKPRNQGIDTGIRLVGKNGQLQRAEPTTNRFPPRFRNIDLLEPPIFAYGADRRMGAANLEKSDLSDPLATNATLIVPIR